MEASHPTVFDARVERTRLVVLAEARRILIEEGWDAVTHLRVAQASGVGRATLYRHWPGRSDLLHDVLWREAEMHHIVPTGRLRDDLVAECEALRRQLADPALTGVIAVLIERSLHDPELRRVKDSVNREVSRVVRDVFRHAMDTGELPPTTDLDLAAAALLGPLLYCHLVSGGKPGQSITAAIVDGFLGGHAS